MDKISLHAMEFYAYHGVLEEEAKLGQKFIADVELGTDLQKAGKSDNLQDTLNYVEIYDVVKQTIQMERYKLIEAIAETIASRLLERFPQVNAVWVKVTKVTPPIEGIMAGASIEIERFRK